LHSGGEYGQATAATLLTRQPIVIRARQSQQLTEISISSTQFTTLLSPKYATATHFSTI